MYSKNNNKLPYPSLLLVDLRQELLVSQRLLQLGSPLAGQRLQLRPGECEGLESLFNFWHTQVGDIHESLASFLDSLDGRLVTGELGFQTSVLLKEVLHAGQVAAVVVGRDEEFLLSAMEDYVINIYLLSKSWGSGGVGDHNMASTRCLDALELLFSMLRHS